MSIQRSFFNQFEFVPLEVVKMAEYTQYRLAGWLNGHPHLSATAKFSLLIVD